MPTPTIEMTNDEPPKLMKGRGSPVKGRLAVTAAMLIRAWNVNHIVIPDAKMKPKESLAWRAIRKPR